MNRHIKAVFFDLDGTLVDTAPDLGAAANRIRQSTGLPPLPLIDYRPVASSGARGLLGKALGITPEHVDFPRHRDALLGHYRAHLADHSTLFKGMAELLRYIEQHNMRWGVVTNKPAWLTRPLIRALALDQSAACVVSADEVGQPKPAPDSLLLGCALSSIAPQDCLYVGDDVRDIVAGRAAGMITVAAAWGYIGNTPLHTWGADLIFDTPSDLQYWLESR